MRLHRIVKIMATGALTIYLLAPSDAPDHKPFDILTPFSQWTTIMAFDTAGQCELTKEVSETPEAIQYYYQNNTKDADPRQVLQDPTAKWYTPERFKERVILSRCMDSDDPRLQTKDN
jgi:hypothetical protein